MTTFTIKEKVHDIDLVVEDIRQAPQTYSTILQDQAFNTTLLFILKRKLNSLCKKGAVMKANIPSTRCGRVILYMLPKKYTIVVESSRVRFQDLICPSWASLPGQNINFRVPYPNDGRFIPDFEGSGHIIGHIIIEHNRVEHCN